MQKKKLKSKIEIVLIYQRTVSSAVPGNLDEEIYTIGNKRILHPIKHIVYDSIEELPKAVTEYASKYRFSSCVLVWKILLSN